MYTIRLKPAPRQGASYAAIAAGQATASGTASNSASGSGQPSPAGTPAAATAATASASPADELDHVSFSAGNPRVEHLVGRVSLFRHLPPRTDGPPRTQHQRQSQREGQQQQQQGPQQDPEQQQQQQQQQQAKAAVSHSEIQPAASADLFPAAAGGTAVAPANLPPGRNEQLCILALPADMGFAELCTFMGAYFQHVREMRLVRREGRASVCLVLLRFDTQQSADAFFADYNGRPFCLLEPELLCRLVYVKDVEMQAAAEGAAVGSDQPRRAPPGTTELPTCPVCLERLDEHISGIVTTVCNHRFHNECLRRWGDTSCPVCRYCQHSSATTSHCATCNTAADLWICLICGHVGCGRYRGSHAAEHWMTSGHGYALELETQRVWDYVNDSYVHRLIQSKTDGKLVEVPSPAQHSQPGCSGRPPGRASAAPSECGDRFVDPDMEEALVLSKLDALATEYNHLLVTQLESQRQYFEGLLVRQRAEAEAEAEAAGTAAAVAADEAAAARTAAHDAERRRQQADSKLADTSARLKRAEEERGFLKQLNDTLLANQKEFQVRLKAAEERLAEMTMTKDAVIRDLQEQVRDLMVFLEARATVEAAGPASELEGGTVLPVPVAQPEAARRGSAKQRGRNR